MAFVAKTSCFQCRILEWFKDISKVARGLLVCSKLRERVGCLRKLSSLAELRLFSFHLGLLFQGLVAEGGPTL